MELVLKPFSKDIELEAQRKLFIECFPENIGTPAISNEYYLWKFHSISKPIGSYEYIAKMDNEIIGYYAAIPYPYIVFDKKVCVAMVCDVMTGVKARGKGIFTKLGSYSINEFKKEGLAFSTGYPIRPEVIPGHKKVGWDFPFEIPMYGKFLSFNSYLKSKNKSYLRIPSNLIIKLYNSIIGNVNYKNKKYLTVEIYSQKELFDITGLQSFFDKWQVEQNIGLLKSITFLKWRLGAPEKEYSIIVLRKNSEIIGYAIVREVVKENVPCIGILDFSFLEENKKYSSVLFREIEKVAKEKNAELILMMMMKNQANGNKVKLNGFLKTPFKFSFIINQFDKTLDKSALFNENNWCLMWIDSDDL